MTTSVISSPPKKRIQATWRKGSHHPGHGGNWLLPGMPSTQKASPRQASPRPYSQWAHLYEDKRGKERKGSKLRLQHIQNLLFPIPPFQIPIALSAWVLKVSEILLCKMMGGVGRKV